MIGPFGWLLGLVGIVILATCAFLLQRDWFEATRGRKRRLSPKMRRLMVGGMVLGFGLFVVAMIAGPHR